MKKIHALASEPHFLRHLLPVWRALPDEARGTLVGPARLAPWADGEPLSWQMPPRGAPLLVASYGDLRRGRGRPVAYMEHGTGQTYLRRHNSYAGGPSRPGVGLFLCQSDRVAAINEDAHPAARQAVIGTPYLDGVHRTVHTLRRLVVSFHWDCPVVPETRSAWRHYMGALPALRQELAAVGVEVAGHAHPRMWATAAPWYARHGITPVEDFREVLETADCYAVDNSSTLYEAAAAGIPVVALNAPWYRREVHHGLRFWSLIPGPQTDGPEGLLAAVTDAFRPDWRDRAARVSRVVYHRPDGGAARAAAAAVVEWLAAGAPRQEATVEDRTAHDPYAPKRRVTRSAPVASTETATEPARRDGGTPPVQSPPEPDDGTRASQAPTGAEAAVEYVDAATSDDDERERAREVWDAELQRAPSDRRVTVQRRVSRVLDEVPDPDQVAPEDTDNVPGDTLTGDGTPQEAPGSPESAGESDGSGDTSGDDSATDADDEGTQDG